MHIFIHKNQEIILQMFTFEHTKLNQEQSEQLAHFLIWFRSNLSSATSEFDVAKINVELNLPLKATAVFKNSLLHAFVYIRLQILEKVKKNTWHSDTLWYSCLGEHWLAHYGERFLYSSNKSRKRIITKTSLHVN